MTAPDYDAALARYRELVAGFEGQTVKGKANPYTSMNGNMFSFLDKAGILCLRMSKQDREDWVARHGTTPVEQYGAIMREYVQVPETLAADAGALRAAFETCLSYARTLPAKPTTRSKN